MINPHNGHYKCLLLKNYLVHLKKKKSYFVLVGSVATKNNSSKGFDATNMEKVPA